MSNHQELDQKRAIAQGVLDRAETDEAFLASLRSDPVGVLTAAGLDVPSAEAMADAAMADASGYAAPRQDCKANCDTITCILTITLFCRDLRTFATGR